MLAARGSRGLATAEPPAPLAMLSPPVLEAPEERPKRRRRPPSDGPPPPDRWDGGGGGGGRGDEPEGDPGPGERGVGTVEFAFGFFLVAVCTLFAAFLLAWAMLRQGPGWPDEAPHDRLGTLWLSSALLLGSELAMIRTAHPGARRRTRRRVAWAAVLGLGFLLAQGWTWLVLVRAGQLPSKDAPRTIFFALTGLHGLHVLGGLAFMGLLVRRLSRPTPGPVAGLVLCRVYWHVMGAIWLVVFTALYFGG